MDPQEFAALIAESVKKAMTPETPAPTPAPAAEPVQKGVSLDDVKNLLIASFGEFAKQVDAKIEKATTFSRDGVGRVGQVAPEDSRDADPLKYIVKKAAGDPNQFDDLDKTLIGELTIRALREGMLYE